MNLRERKEMVKALKCVDEVVINHAGEDSRPAILSARADVIIHGDDWTGPALKEQLGVTDAWLDRHSIKMAYLPYTPDISTSEIIKRIYETYGDKSQYSA